ncbi:hypothetical protein HDV62DRAFT_185184 [Trichoderma sp. SZMC 28011]
MHREPQRIFRLFLFFPRVSYFYHSFFCSLLLLYMPGSHPLCLGFVFPFFFFPPPLPPWNLVKKAGRAEKGRVPCMSLDLIGGRGRGKRPTQSTKRRAAFWFCTYHLIAFRFFSGRCRISFHVTIITR